ncbi:MAG: HlyD family efflux transporter periplasmic adaptor subunit [Clostridiales bacterium]|nr:HlyD family efflux transporter periplasmic adaptor subunit [Clostridiales bacterium]
MKKKKTPVIITVIVLIVLGVAGGLALLRKQMDNIAKNMARPAEVQVEKGSIEKTIDGFGSVGVAENVEIKIPSEIKVSEVEFQVGDQISEGDIIAVLDTASITSAIIDVQDELDDVTEELKKTDLTEYEKEELETRQTELEDKKALLLAYYENPYLAAGFEGIVSEVPAIDQSSSSSSSLSGIDISSILPVSCDLTSREEEILKADNDNVTEISDIDDLDLAAPVAGADPQTSIDSEDGYSGIVFWSPTVSGKFLNGTVYTAIVVLTPDTGYAFASDIDPEIDGAQVETELENGILTLSITYPATASAETTDPTDSTDPTETTDPTAPTESSEPSDFTMPSDFGDFEGTMPSVDLEGLIGQDAMQSYSDALTSAITSAAISSAMPSFSGTGITSFSGLTGGSSSYQVGSSSENTVMKIAKTETVRVTLSISELDIMDVELGQDVRITLESSESEYTGQVTNISYITANDSGTARYNVEVELPMEDDMLFGMSVNASIIIGVKEDVLLLPMRALQQTGDTTFVYKSYEEDGTLSGDTPVDTGLSDGINVEITGGVSEGETIYYTSVEENSILAYME